MNRTTEYAVLMFHNITTIDKRDKYTLSPEAFTRIIDRIKNDRIVSSKAIFTFDDGYESSYSIVMPELMKRKVVGTFFIVPSYVGEKNFLKWDQIRCMVKEGMKIGSHSIQHRTLTLLSQKEAFEDMKKSREILQDKLEVTIDKIALPGGFTNKLILETAIKAGYRSIYTSRPGIWKNNSCIVPRYCVYYNTMPERILKVISGKTSMFYIVEKTKWNIKTILPTYLYLNAHKIKKNLT